ncbi:hypothetical protein C8R45DRAFT_985074 [Mycena sanguinolenta]|nr:hypothetical protein C8R45DRAFT_985074 [Mycena sanguinolenta]
MPVAPTNRQNPGNQTAAQTTGNTNTNYTGGNTGTQHFGAPTATATAPPPAAGNDPYLNRVNEEASRGHHTTQNFGASTTATAPPPMAGNDPYLNKVNQEASRGRHNMNAGDPYNPHHDSTVAAQNIPVYDGPGNAQQHLARGDRPAEEPRHHRDDAISSAPGQTRSGPPQYVAATGAPPIDIGGQYREEEVM